MSTWNTEPPKTRTDKLIKGSCGDYLVAYYHRGIGWIPVNVNGDYVGGIEHNLDDPIVWQELPE